MSANDSSERAANSGSSSTLSTTVSSRLIATIYSEVEHTLTHRGHAEAIPSTEEASVACTRMDDVTVFRGEHEAHYKCTAVAG